MRDRTRKRKQEILFGRRSAELSWLSKSILTSWSPIFGDCQVKAEYYPYVGLRHSIRRKGRCWLIRISDHCRVAPRPVLEAILTMLACKILHRRPARHILRTYERFRADPAVEASVRLRRKERGFKRMRSSGDSCYSLPEILEEVNHKHFNGQVEISRIGWGTRMSWSRLGHYDPVHHTITVSPVLDSPRVPRFVISFIVFHEVLHAVFEGPSERNRYHSLEFKRAEQAYPNFAAAKKFLLLYTRSRGGWPRAPD